MRTTAPALFIVDAFADGPFTGNPAAVVLLERQDTFSGWPDAAWMQRLADEMNLSETAFVLPTPRDANPNPQPDGQPDTTPDAPVGLRWFTPNAEVELCGHATLASAHVLFRESPGDGHLPPRAGHHEVHFQTRYAGVLTCTRSQHGSAITMDFPALVSRPVQPPPGLFDALRLHAREVRATHFGPYDFLLELDRPDRVADLQPDFAALARFECRGVAVTAAVPFDHPEAHARFRDARIVSRFFAPRLRIAEDPVTGSLHCVLGPYWADRLGTTDFRACQASRRGGILQVGLRDPRPACHAPAAGGGPRVALTGQAHTVLRGRLAHPPT